MTLRWWEVLFTLRAAKGSFSENAEGVERLVPYVFAAAFFCLCLGVVLPVVRVRDFLIFTDTIAIYQGIWDLFKDGEFFLAVVVLAFSIVLPTVKVIVADVVWRIRPADDHRTNASIQMLEWVGRWSMLDILVIALVIFSLKASMLGDARTEPGMYFFAASIFLSSIGVGIIKRAANRRALSVSG